MGTIPERNYRAKTNTSTVLLDTFYSRVWNTEEIPADWKEVYLVTSEAVKERRVKIIED